MRGFYGNCLIRVRALTYIWSLGSDGLREMSDTAVLYANLIRHRLAESYNLAYDSPSLHEVVFDDTRQTEHDVHNTDIAKRLLDYGFHPPTMSFPLIVHGALMIEPAESVPPEEVEPSATPCSPSPGRPRRTPSWSAPPRTTPRSAGSTRSAPLET